MSIVKTDLSARVNWKYTEEFTQGRNPGSVTRVGEVLPPNKICWTIHGFTMTRWKGVVKKHFLLFLYRLELILVWFNIGNEDPVSKK